MKKTSLLLLLLLLTLPVCGLPLTREEIDTLIPSGTYSAERVRSLVWEMSLAADLEIKRTSEEAVKAAVDPLKVELAGVTAERDTAVKGKARLGIWRIVAIVGISVAVAEGFLLLLD